MYVLHLSLLSSQTDFKLQVYHVNEVSKMGVVSLTFITKEPLMMVMKY